jgi:ribosome recycling factor
MHDIESKLAEVEKWLVGEFSGIRTGQATPALLDSVKVESYGSFMALNQVASLGIEDARTLRIAPWDASLVKAIETAIRDADLGVSVVADSSGVRIIFPDLTSERRTQLQKLAKAKLEEARVAVRAVREDAMKTLDKKEKEGEISEDDKFKGRDVIQKKVDSANLALEALYAKKDTQIHT